MSNQRTPSEQWQLDGSSPEAYERYLVPRMFAPWADRLVERVAPESGERVLDVACGTGIVARRAAARIGGGGTVVGLDVNDGMLDAARAASSDIRPAITWQHGDAAALPFSDGSFDAVFCQQALQFFPEPVVALREMHRVLAPDGRLGLAVWRPIEHNSAYVPMADALNRHAGAEAGAMMRSPFPSWDREALRDLVSGAEFRKVRIRIGIGTMRYPSAEEFLRREAASSPLAGPIGALEADVREALIRDLVEVLVPYTDDDGIVFLMETHIASAAR